jgi:hypothetical protein
MSLSYSEIPPGGVVNIPPSIPTGMLYRVKSISGISKQTLKLVPISGQTTVTNGQKIIVELPPNSLVDLSTFEMFYKGSTSHGGNGSIWDTVSGTATNAGNFVNKRYFPRNSSSIIENLEIKINGQSRQNINQYNYIYNILNDFNCGTDCTTKNRIGMNADPSNKSTYVNGRTQRYAGYPVGCSSQSTDNSHLDSETYNIRNWLGILGGNASTQIIDTSLYGSIVIEITLAAAGILMLSPPVGTLASYTSVTNTETNISTTASTAAAAVASQGNGYKLEDISFQITRYDMVQSYFDAVASVLQSGAVFKLYYPNYSVFMGGQQSLPKGGTTRFNLSTQSLDSVISTFQVVDREIQQAPILGQANANGWGSVPGDASIVGVTSTAAAAGEYGSQFKTFNYALQLGVAKTLNNSKFFVRNGDGIERCTYICGNVRLIPESIPEQFNGVLRAFNTQSDTLGGLYPGILSLAHYQSQFYAHILSLNVTTEHEMYTVSGLNCSATPISIAWEVTGSASAANFESQATSNGNIWKSGSIIQNATPVMIACYTSHLEVSAGRNIITVT